MTEYKRTPCYPGYIEGVFEAYIIKGCLQEGIRKMYVTMHNREYAGHCLVVKDDWGNHYKGRGEEWCLTWDDALKTAEKHRERELIALNDVCRQLRRLMFVEPGTEGYSRTIYVRPRLPRKPRRVKVPLHVRNCATVSFGPGMVKRRRKIKK